MNDKNSRLFLACFMTLIAAGIGFAVRGEILGAWSAQFGFTQLELGTITGGGLVGFGLIIILASLITDRVGYRTILMAACLCHILSLVVTVAASAAFESGGKESAYQCLYWGSFIFAIANGLCEAAINPLTADLYPNQKTHYLNILHAGWPGGLVLGGLINKMFLGNAAWITELKWEIALGFYLVPTLYYGMVVLRNPFPQSEASKSGISYGRMLAELASPVLLFLFLLHACVGYVELGTDSWIQAITGAILSGQGPILFVWASILMFGLRFFAGPIVERINPIGLLLISAVTGAIGLVLIGTANGTAMIWIAVTVYALGKTFYWPTMLGVVGERFPRGGAVTMGMLGGIGMLSAGFLGAPGIGYKQDYFASKQLESTAAETYGRYKADKPSNYPVPVFPEITGLDGGKVAVILDEKGAGATLADTVAKLPDNEDVKKRAAWWKEAQQHQKTDKQPIDDARIYGGRQALIYTAIVPAFMAFGYLVLALYFRSTGGYTVEHLDGGGDSGEETGAASEMPPADSENVDGGSDEMTPADSENVYGGSDDAG
ncbi:MAG: MFS transporter [Planctomycetaceae bacterium]